MNRRGAAARAAIVVLLTVGGLAGCAGDDTDDSPDDDLPTLTDPAQPQSLTAKSRLFACGTDAEDPVSTRVASVVLPREFTESLVQLRGEPAEPDDDVRRCAFRAPRLRVAPTPDLGVFRITLPTTGSLAEATFAVHRAPVEPVVREATVLGGQQGERASYSAQGRPSFASGDGRRFAVRAEQAGGVRLEWLMPLDATPAQVADSRRLWREVRASLAVRSPAAGDGDVDADSDTAPPEGDTTTPTPVQAVEPDPGAAYRPLTCTAGGVTVSLRRPARLRAGRDCAVSTSRQSVSASEILSVAVAPQTSLWDRYREVREFEGEGGDDSTSSIEYDADVVGVGGQPAESLVYTASNDGNSFETHVVQGSGIQVSWSVRPLEWGPQIDELRAVLDSVTVSGR